MQEDRDNNPTMLSRAQGCLLGQLSGDSLGSLVEFQPPEQILAEYPQGVRELADYVRQQGWVLIAFQNALWQLVHAPTLEEGLSDTVMRGGDTDTNAAICGALLGAVHGKDALPPQWVDRVLNCRPVAGRPNVHRPRPECFWPVDALELAEQLLMGERR